MNNEPINERQNEYSLLKNEKENIKESKRSYFHFEKRQLDYKTGLPLVDATYRSI